MKTIGKNLAFYVQNYLDMQLRFVYNFNKFKPVLIKSTKKFYKIIPIVHWSAIAKKSLPGVDNEM